MNQCSPEAVFNRESYSKILLQHFRGSIPRDLYIGYVKLIDGLEKLDDNRRFVDSENTPFNWASPSRSTRWRVPKGQASPRRLIRWDLAPATCFVNVVRP